MLLSYPPGCSSRGTLSFIGNGDDVVAGGYASAVVDGFYLQACDTGTMVGSGQGSIIGGDGKSVYASIVGGEINNIEGGIDSFIGGGNNNLISYVPLFGQASASAIVAGGTNSLSSPFSFIGAGILNTIVPPTNLGETCPCAFIGSGYRNTLSSDFSVITGGYGNSNTGEYATIAGGFNNMVSGIQGVVSGGHGNVASGRNAVVPGGAYNTAGGLDSFAAGNAAKATYDGTFVWSDYSATSGITSTAPNQFLARAAGGFYLYSSASLKSGVKLAPGSGSWSSLSDRAAKTGIKDVDDARILAKVASLPVNEWSYSAQGTGIRHLGPMA